MSDQTSAPVRRGPGSPQTRRPRLRGEARDTMRATLADRYRAHDSIRKLAAEHDLSFGLTRTLLQEAGVEMRGRGSRRPAAGQ
ncbi:helix-turn-helix domain-containing protein [Streptomyces sp. DT224]|uniref:helix-turn-helix domain-containing protein n=1 Tax=Streptomyces sp. DT224 TaxID=3393426 RepID=UPI003CF4C5D7